VVDCPPVFGQCSQIEWLCGVVRTEEGQQIVHAGEEGVVVDVDYPLSLFVTHPVHN